MEELMDHALVEFRKAAGRENRGRRGLQRRYSAAVQQQAVDYCRLRRRAGDGFRTVAAALGVADWSLRRWMKAAKNQAGFHPVHVVIPRPAPPVPSLVIRLTSDGPQVEGLDVEAAAQLLTRLR
jgi:transposase-like protein